MNFLKLCEPEYMAQVKAVETVFNEYLCMPLWHFALENTLFFLPILIVLGLIIVPFGIVGVVWSLHPIMAVIAVLFMVGGVLVELDKEEIKRTGKWTAQDETNERLGEMDLNNIIMQRQILDVLQELAEGARKTAERDSKRKHA